MNNDYTDASKVNLKPVAGDTEEVLRLKLLAVTQWVEKVRIRNFLHAVIWGFMFSVLGLLLLASGTGLDTDLSGGAVIVLGWFLIIRSMVTYRTDKHPEPYATALIGALMEHEGKAQSSTP